VREPSPEVQIFLA